MARTFLAGEAAVKLIPNSKTFHHTARRELAKDKLKHGVDLVANAKGFTRDAKARLAGAKLSVDVGLRPDISGFRRDAQAKIDAGRPLKLTVRLEAKADRGSVRAARETMQAQLDAMRPLNIKVEANTTGATAHLTEWIRTQSLRRIEVTVNANTRGAQRSITNLRGRGGGGGGPGILGRRPIRNAAIGAAATFAPIVSQASVGGLIAIAGAASQAAGALGLLPAVITAAGAGFAALGIGLSGISGAFQALSKQAAAGDNAAASGRAAASAARQVENAERGLAKTQKQVGIAQEALNKARKQAVRDLRDMNDQLRKAPINEAQAALAIKQAQKDFQDALASGDSLQIEGAQLDVEQAKIDYDILKKQNQDLAADVADANRKGVEGADDVVEAKRGVADANEAVIDAQSALTEAIEAQTAAMEQQAQAADEVAKAFAKLSPNAQVFVRKMQLLGPAWTDLRKAVQDRLFDQLGDSVTTLANKQLPIAKLGLMGIAQVLNGGIRESMGVFSTTSAQKDFALTLGNFVKMYQGIANAMAPLSRAFINVVTVGSDFLPRMGAMIERNAKSFADFTDRTRASGAMKQFFEDSLTAAKQLGRILGNVGKTIYNFFGAGQDVGGSFLDTIERATRELKEFTESALGLAAMQRFFSGVAEAARTLAPIIKILALVIFGTLGPALTDLVIGLGPGLVSMLDGLAKGLSSLSPVMKPLGEEIGTVGVKLGEVFQILGPGLAGAISGLLPGIEPLAKLLGDIAIAVIPLLPLIGQLVGAFVAALAPALDKIVLAVSPFIKSIVESLTPAVGPLMKALGGLADMCAAILVPAIKLVGPVLVGLADFIAGTVRQGERLVNWGKENQDVLKAIAVAITVFLLPALTVLIARQILYGVVWGAFYLAILAYTTAMKIATAVQTAFNIVMSANPIGIVVLAIGALVAGLIYFFTQTETGKKVWAATWDFIKTSFAAFMSWIQPVIDFFANHWREVFDLIAKAVSLWWNYYVMPIFNALKATIGVVADVITWWWHSIVEPAFKTVGDVISFWWNNIVKPAFEALKGGLKLVGDFFTSTIDGIKSAWSALGRIAANPINFIIKEVINGGIGKGWKAVDSFLGNVLPDWKDVDEIKIPGMATGGLVPMAPGAIAGKDSVLRNLMPGEIVMSVPAVQALGAANLLAANRAAQMGGVDAQGLFPTNISDMAARIRSSQYGMEAGGMVRPDDPAFLALKKAHEWAASRDGRPYVLGGSADGGNGTDCSGFMSGIANIIQGGSGARQWATMAFNGGGNAQMDNGPQGFKAGLAAGFSIGVLNGGPAGGHTAGTLGGVLGLPTKNVESGGSHGNVAYGGPAVGADNSQFPTQYHLPIIGGNFVSAGQAGQQDGGPDTRAAGQRRGITRQVEKTLNTILDPAKALVGGFGTPPPAMKAIPSAIYDNTVEPMKKWVLDKVSELTSIAGWRDKFKSTLDKMNPLDWFDQGGVANGVGFMAKNTIAPERVLSPYETELFEGLLRVLGIFGIQGQSQPIPVDIKKVDGMPTTADTKGRGPVIEGQAYGQPLQGAAIDPKTGEYLPANNVPGAKTGTAPAKLFTETKEWKTARNLSNAVPFNLGPGKQMDKIAEKAPQVAQLGAGIAKAAPAYAAALAGNPAALLTNIATETAAWAQKTATDFATYLPENAGGILESALSALGGPLIGTVNTGMSQGQLVETMEDVQNRKARRSKEGRSRRG